jgi:hypothetical protein
MAEMNKFDFDAYNKLTNNIAPGLQVALAEGLIRSALYSMERYNNPLTDELFEVNQELKLFRVKYKAAADERKKAQAAVAGIEN